ncbi:hypothetical protein BABINDRAFT_39926 [Babjeviella inositovora NRRL Y-12698]|uniref:Uncharacterized protein n=1 Tax=Babjeviella inositovora NRRL Y-12698 TaxID=984486 RepID=A0A1E3QKR9_9ASCO|nr:uncharacterized protein BABINDRAFT_39926 [Babjeviella inositovora NRRL Y-12698]ODQ78281.1 hypothetical protein BABINDRAFT_39926 [Babjeviella inositovora NRRL Y-12698]
MPNSLARVSELLKTEDDLAKVATIKEQFAKEKASIDVKLNAALQQQIETIMRNIRNLNSSSAKIATVKTNLLTIDAIYRDSKTSIARYDVIQEFTRMHAYIQETGELYTNMSHFHVHMKEVEALIDSELSQGIQIDSLVPQLLRIHYNLNAAANFRDRLERYAATTNSDFRSIVARIVAPLVPAEEKFRGMLHDIITGLVESLKDGNVALVLKVFRVVEYEEREDLKLALAEKLGLEAGLSLTSQRSKPREYFAFFLKSIEDSINETFQNCEDAFENKIDVLDNLDWIFNDLLMVKNELMKYAPARWCLFDRYYTFYHARMHAFINETVARDPSSEEILRILSFDKLYTDVAVNELQIAKKDIKPLFKDKEEFLDNYLTLMTDKVTEWMGNLEVREQEEFKARTHLPESADDLYTLQAITTIFQIFNQQINIAADSGYGKIVNGVVASFCAILNRRTTHWNALLRAEVDATLNSTRNNVRATIGSNAEEVSPGLLEYTIALANDQIKSVHYCETILDSYSGMLSRKYQDEVSASLNQVMDGFVDLGNNCIHSLVVIMFNDLIPNFDLILSSQWYKQKSPDKIVQPIAETLMDYLTDFESSLNGVLLDLLVDSTVDYTILYYFKAMRFKHKFKNDKLFGLVTRDVELLFPVFAPFYNSPDEVRTVEVLQRKFRVFELFMDLVSIERDQIPGTWNEILDEFSDFSLEFIEGVLSCRKDIDSAHAALLLSELKGLSEAFKYKSHAVPLVATFMKKFRLEGDIL